MRKALFFLCCFSWLTASSIQAQTYIQPSYELRTNPRVTITKVEIDKAFTKVYFKYTSSFLSGSVCVDTKIFIEDEATKKRYALLETHGVENCPEQRILSNVGEVFEFILYFERVPYNVRYINIFEDLMNGFNFKKIHLLPLAH